MPVGTDRAATDTLAVEVMAWRSFARRWLPILEQSTICLRSSQRVALAREVRQLMQLLGCEDGPR